MGKKVDFFVLTAGITVCFYFYFRSVFDHPVICVVLSLLTCTLLRRFLQKLGNRIHGSGYMQRRRLRKYAGGALMRLAGMDEEEAVEKLSALIEKTYAETYPIEPLLRHPSSCLGADDIFTVWKAHKGSENLVICATCRADSACQALIEELKTPRIALIDADALSSMMAEHPEGIFPEKERVVRRKLRLRHLADLFFNRKNAPKCLMMFLSMLTIYVFSFNPFYFASAMFLLFVSLVSLRRKNKPAKLF